MNKPVPHQHLSIKLNPFSKEQYIAALNSIQSQTTSQQRRMLRVHAESYGRTITVSELRASAALNNDRATRELYAQLGRMLAMVLEPGADFGDDPSWTEYIGDHFWLNHGGSLTWRMHEALAEALVEMSWARHVQPQNPFTDIEEAEDELDRVPDKTERENIVLSRVGQGRFRDRILKYWKACAVTGVDIPEALRASHIKPWSRSTNKERLDKFNGLLLIGTLDLLFDAGLISFENDGLIRISNSLSANDRESLGLKDTMKLRHVDQRHCRYLQFHQTKQFCDY